MKILLIFFTALFIGFWSSGLLYVLNSKNLIMKEELTENNKKNIQPLSLTSDFNIPRNNCYEIAIKCPENHSLNPGEAAVGGIGDENDVEDCQCIEKCGIGFAETYILPDSNTIYNNQLLEPGKYCLPKTTIQCDKNLGHLIYSNGKFLCQCKHPDIFGGPSCDKPQTCLNGILRHSQTHELIDKFNITDNNYHCSCDIPDKDGNQMINFSGNKLECYSDPCLKELSGQIIHDIGYDINSGHCLCGDYNTTRVKNMIYNDPTTPCTSCFIEDIPELNKTILNFKCASKNGDLSYASPCRNFNLQTQCEQVEVNIKIQNLVLFKEAVIKFGTKIMHTVYDDHYSHGFDW